MANQAYIVKFKPYLLSADNYVALANEILASAYLLGLLSLSAFNKSDDLKERVSLGLLGISLFSFAFNMLYALWLVCAHFKLRLKKMIKAKIHSQ
jgi:hypothetical protein